MVRHRIRFDIKVLRILSILERFPHCERLERVSEEWFAFGSSRHEPLERNLRRRGIVPLPDLGCFLLDPFLVGRSFSIVMALVGYRDWGP